MEQYARIKSKHTGDVLLFRLGDFYEMFYDDAVVASKTLGIVLTSRQKGDGRIPMCGVPFHSAQSYINRLLHAGHRVAVCEQLEDAEEAKGIVDRGVVRVITPGTLVEEGLLEENRNNYLAAVRLGGDPVGLAWIDLSTGLFRAEDVPLADLEDELSLLSPSETLLPEGQTREQISGIVTPAAEWTFDADSGRRELCDHFGTQNLAGFGCDELGPALGAAGAILHYLKDTQKSAPRHVTRIARHVRGARVFLDRQTQTSLELTETMRDGKREGSLLGVLDRTRTAMGARLLRDWITSPLREKTQIEQRLDAVEELRGDTEVAGKLKGFGDLERTLARLGSGRATPRDLAALRDSLSRLPELRSLSFQAPLLDQTARDLGDHRELHEELSKALVDRPPALLTDEGIIRSGLDAQLDEIRDIASGGKDWLTEFEAAETKRTGIPSLKVGFNRVFGYYIEVTHNRKEKVPAEYVRRQTLKNAERYITPELKEHETKVLQAEERAKKLEQEIFRKLRERAASHIAPLQKSADAVARLDVLGALGRAAQEYGYARPGLDNSDTMEIEEGRHPVLERIMADRFVPNDTAVGGDTRVLLLTGPNMAGKSTYIRQVALLVLMAQMGSFVPAKRLRLGVVDRIFTRVGAADELARGASTFMVEMNETANILNHATSKSLVILDEIGRGTSTFDGVSIAWAVTEFLHDRIGSRTLFATHYHELTELAGTLPGVKNLHIAVREWRDSIVFLHQIVKGATDKSYGIHVARLAGIPTSVVERAKVILASLEALTLDHGNRLKPGDLQQLSLFTKLLQPKKEDRLREELQDVEPDKLTPIDALKKIAEWKRKYPPAKHS